jgi:hypothetical protein
MDSDIPCPHLRYTFASNQTNKAHGLYGTASDGRNVGAWWVVNQKDTFFGGPVCHSPIHGVMP